MMSKIKLKSYQKEALFFGLKKRTCAWFIDPGMGKTAIALSMLSLLKRKKKAKRFLVVASLNIMYNTWPEEIEKWDQFKSLSYTLLHGKDKETKLRQKSDVYLINPEGLKWLLSKEKTFDVLIIDESSKFKNPSSQRFKLLKKQLDQFRYRVIMSGTPTPNSYQDLFSQMYIVDLGEAFGKYITHFRNKYYNLVNPKFYTYELKNGADKAIKKKMTKRAFVLRNTKIEKPIFNFIKVQMDQEVKDIYQSMEKKFFAEIENEKIFAVSAGSAYRKCHQIANGAFYETDSTDFYDLHDAKIEALKELMAELQGKPLLVGYLYKHDALRIKEAFPNTPHIGGGVKQKTRKEIIDAWNSGKIPLLLGQIGSVSHGLNLQKSNCEDVCYFSLTDDPDAYEQFYRRVYGRHGSKRFIRVHHIVTKSTVDMAILRRLRQKEKQQISLLEAIREYQKTK
jgi:SNF2 family DNA or RNA helicase